MKNNILESTLKYDLCIGCGICKAVCPKNAIEIRENEYREVNPFLNDKCINCGLCVEYCPNTLLKLKKESSKIAGDSTPNSYGIEKQNNCYIGYIKNEAKRLKSASGGIVSFLLEEMLNRKIVDSIIHVEQSKGEIGKSYFAASISKSIKELENKRSSFYSMIDFSGVISEFINKNEKIVLTGTPCIIRGMKKLFEKNILYQKNKVFFIALPCSHNVNGQFIDFLAESLGIEKGEKFKVNLRAKNKEMKDSNNFINLFKLENRKIEIERNKSIFTKYWRSYCFALNACLYCSDFWGYEGDVSVKDAWGKWANKEAHGVSMAIIRNPELEKLFEENEKIYLEKISYEEAVSSQKETTYFKQVCALDKIENNKFKLFKIGFYFKWILLKYSKKLYKKNDFKKSYKKLNILIEIFNLSEKIIKKLTKTRME